MTDSTEVAAVAARTRLAIREIPFLLGTSANQSFSIIGNVQDAIRQCDTTYVTPNTLTGEPIRIPTAVTLGGATTTGSGRLHQRTSSSHGQRTPSGKRKAGKHAVVSATILGVPPPMPATILSERTRTGAAASGKADKRVKPSALQVPPPAPVSAHINPMQVRGALVSPILSLSLNSSW